MKDLNNNHEKIITYLKEKTVKMKECMYNLKNMNATGIVLVFLTVISRVLYTPLFLENISKLLTPVLLTAFTYWYVKFYK